jgi:hypothetical protein
MLLAGHVQNVREIKKGSKVSFGKSLGKRPFGDTDRIKTDLGEL